jgi:streptogramin lyase
MEQADMTAGSDGAFWFTNLQYNSIGHLIPS